MQLLVCIAGLPQEALDEVSKRPPRFSGSKANPPIAFPVRKSLAYLAGDEKRYHEALSEKISKFNPNDDAGIVVAYVNFPGASDFIQKFFPFALVSPIEPFYYNCQEKSRRREALKNFLKTVEATTRELRSKSLVIKDYYSGNKFTHLTLPLRNFRSDHLKREMQTLFQELGYASNPRLLIQNSTTNLGQLYPLKRSSGHHQFFEDDRQLCFKSPGTARHGWNRGVSQGHDPSCHINSRVRLGGPLKANFHYDCSYLRRELDAFYLNCHDKQNSPAQTTHVNISPNDAIR